jgi:TPR repeat protein
MKNSDTNINSECYSLLFDKEEEKAFECFLANSKTGDSNANYMMGEMYLNGSGTNKDELNAIKHYLNSNEPLAQYRLGQIYCQGWGVEINSKLAIEWLTKAADQGLVEANYYLGHMLSVGLATEKNIPLAVQMLEKVANSGSKSKFMSAERHREYLALSQDLLRHLYSQAANFPELDANARQSKSNLWLFEAALNGNEQSKAILVAGGRFTPTAGGDSCANQSVFFTNSDILKYSDFITKKYDGKEIEIFDVAINAAKELLAEDIKKSDEGDPEATYWMAERYEDGLMVEKDLKKAFQYVKNAADKGYTCAQAKLGMFLLKGIGAKIDIGQSIKYLTLAQAKDESFSYGLALAYDAEGPYQNLNKAYELFIAVETHWKIGLYNELGLIGLPNLSRAKEEYQTAADKGVDAAKVRLSIWQFLGIETVEDVENASQELHHYRNAESIQALIMIGYYEKQYFEFLPESGNNKSKDIAQACFECAEQCLRAYPHFNDSNLYGPEIRNRILLRGINWFIKAFNHDEYTEIHDFRKQEFIKSISSQSGEIISFHSSNLISPKTLYIFARQFRIAGLESIALPMYEKLAYLDVGVAQYIIAMSFAQGDFKPQNYIKAYAWLNLAYSRGVKLASSSKENVASQIPRDQIIQCQKLAEDIKLIIDSSRTFNRSYDGISEIESLDLSDLENSHDTNSDLIENKIPNVFKFKKPKPPRDINIPEKKYDSPHPSSAPVHESKPETTSLFGTIVKVLLFLPFAAMFAWVVYAIGILLLLWIFVKFAV